MRYTWDKEITVLYKYYKATSNFVIINLLVGLVLECA